MTSEQLENQKASLLNMRGVRGTKVRDGIRNSRQSIGGVARDVVDTVEVADDSAVKELDLVITVRRSLEVAAIEEALLRIQVGTYGLCEECGDPIGERRLTALPYAKLCVTCKTKEEGN